ncbi:MAG: thermonuclease family protein [Rickettsiales endosymbiont of Dermacentor nuttalli]
MHNIRSNFLILPVIIISILALAAITLSYLKQYYNSQNKNIIFGYHVKVVDGDTIKIDNIRIRLYGIDAPERHQVCYNKKTQKPYNCGLTAKQELKHIIQGKKVSCHKKSIDKYNRIIAICYVDDSIDIARELVKKGLALAYTKFSNLYIEDELHAKQNHSYRNNEFTPPWEYRYYKKKYRLKQKIS